MRSKKREYNGWTVNVNRNVIIIWDPFGTIKLLEPVVVVFFVVFFFELSVSLTPLFIKLLDLRSRGSKCMLIARYEDAK